MSSEATPSSEVVVGMDVETVVLDPIARVEKSIEDVEASIKKIETRQDDLAKTKAKALEDWSLVERRLYTDHVKLEELEKDLREKGKDLRQEKKDLREKEKDLRQEKKDLREKEKDLRDQEKRLVATQLMPAGTFPLNYTNSEVQSNLTPLFTDQTHWASPSVTRPHDLYCSSTCGPHQQYHFIDIPFLFMAGLSTPDAPNRFYLRPGAIHLIDKLNTMKNPDPASFSSAISGLFIHGPPGSGKSCMTWLWALRQAFAGVPLLWIHVFDTWKEYTLVSFINGRVQTMDTTSESVAASTVSAIYDVVIVDGVTGDNP